MSDQPSFLLMVPVYTLSIFPFSPSYPSNTNIFCNHYLPPKYKEVQNDKYGKQKEKYFNTFSFQFICKFSRASLAADRPTDRQEKSFPYWQLRSTCCQDLFGIWNTKHKKYQIQKTQIWNTKQKTDIYLGKRYLFLCTTLPSCGWNMVSIKKVNAYFGTKN